MFGIETPIWSGALVRNTVELPTCSFSENHPRGGVAGAFRARRLMSLHPGLKRLGYSVRPLRGHRKRSKHQRGEDLLQNRAAADSGWPIFNAPVGPRSVGRGLSLKITPRAAWCHSRTSICETAQMCRKSSNNPPTEELRSRIDTLVASRATRTIIIDAIPTNAQNAEHETPQAHKNLGTRRRQAHGLHQLQHQASCFLPMEFSQRASPLVSN